jgi:hypothetical protein
MLLYIEVYGSFISRIFMCLSYWFESFLLDLYKVYINYVLFYTPNDS